MIVQKRENMVDGIEEVIVSLYAKGMSVADIEDQIRDVYNFEVSTSTISRIKPRIAEDIVSWQNWPLEPLYLIVWLAADRRMESSSKCVKTAKNFVQW